MAIKTPSATTTWGGRPRTVQKPAASGPTPWTNQDTALWGQVSKDPSQLSAWQAYRQQFPNRSLVGWAQRGKPGYKAPAAPAAASPGRSGSGAAPGESGTYKDPIYLAAVARLNFDEANGVAQNDRDSRLEAGNYTSAIEGLLKNRNYQIRNDRQSASSQGILNSTTLDNRISEGAAEYESQRGGLQRQHDYSQESLAAARAALEKGLPIDIAAEAAQSADRASTRTLGEAASGPPDATPPAAAGAPAKSGGSAKLSDAEYQRKYNVLALKYGANSPEATRFRARNPR